MNWMSRTFGGVKCYPAIEQTLANGRGRSCQIGTGAASYLEDPWQSYEGRRSLHFRLLNHTENIKMKKMIRKHPPPDTAIPKQATHVVVALSYGNEMFVILRDDPYCVFHENIFPDCEEEISKEESDTVLNRAADRFVQNLDRNKIEKVEPFDFFLVKADIHWDSLPVYPTTLKNLSYYDAVMYCHLWLTREEYRSTTVPLKVWLCPLDKIYSNTKPDNLFRQPVYNIDLVQQCRKIWSGFAKIKSDVKTLVPPSPKFCTEQQNHLKIFWTLMLQFIQRYRQQVSEIIKDMRSRKLDDLLAQKALAHINSVVVN